MRKKLLTIMLFVLLATSFVCFSACAKHTHAYTKDVTLPTCIEQGYTTYTCSCGDSYVDDYVEATGVHVYGEWTEVTPATCKVEGEEKQVCTSSPNCLDTQTRPIPVKDHVYDSEQVVGPTCSAKGYTLHSCVCGDSYKDTYVDTLPHTFTTKLCAGCQKNIADVAKYKSGNFYYNRSICSWFWFLWYNWNTLLNCWCCCAHL